MKVLRTFNNNEYLVKEDEAENIMKVVNAGNVKMIKLRSGDYISSSGIMEICEPPKIMQYKGYTVNKSGTKFLRDGEWIDIQYPENIEYIEDPKYKENLKRLN